MGAPAAFTFLPRAPENATHEAAADLASLGTCALFVLAAASLALAATSLLATRTAREG